MSFITEKIRRHPLVPLAIIFIIVDACFLSFVRKPESDKIFSEFAEYAETTKKVIVTGEVTAIQAPVRASKGELKYRFRLKNPHFENKDGSVKGDLRGYLPVIWYAPRIDDGGFAPESGAVFELFGKIYKRKNVKDTTPVSLNDVFMISRATTTLVISSKISNSDDVLSRVRYSAAERISLGLDEYPEQKSLILAMTLGFRSDISKKLTTVFRQAGTIHIFAISGLHVMVIAEILTACIGYFGVSKQYWVLFLAPLLAAYVFMTGAQPSAMRAGLMASIYYLAPLLGRKPDSLNAVALSAIILLAIDPVQLSELGFILSFCMVTGIILYTSPIQNAFYRLFRVKEAIERINVDRLADPPTGIKEKFTFSFRHLCEHIQKKAADIVSVSITSSLISFPLTSYYFDFCTPYSLLANVVVVPISEFVMICSTIGLALSCIHPILAIPANRTAAFLAWIMKTTSENVSSLPNSAPDFHFPVIAIVLWYVALWFATRALAKQLEHK